VSASSSQLLAMCFAVPCLHGVKRGWIEGEIEKQLRR